MVPTKLMKAKKQLSLADMGFLPKAGKQTRKAVFLAEMDRAKMMLTKDMKDTVSFSVISHGHGSLLHRLLRQMNSQRRMAGTRVVVTLNLVDEIFDPASYAELDLRIVRNASPKGFGANHNSAFKLCNTDWFGILNPDLALLDEEPFAAMLERANNTNITDLGLIAPRVVSAELKVEDSVRENLTPFSLLSRAMGYRNSLQVRGDAHRGSPFFWVAGMCMLVRADAYSAVKGFDERFFLYCEDYDLCARLYNAGWTIRLDEHAQIIHEAQRDSHRSMRHLQMHLLSLMKVWLSKAFWRVTFKY